MTIPEIPSSDTTRRRNACKGGLAAVLALAVAREATAGERKDGGLRPEPHGANEAIDRIEISDLLMRERWARETHNIDVSTSCYTADAWVEVSWFKGTAAQFIDSGRHPLPPGTASFDSMSPPVTWIKRDRAISETSCAVHQGLKLNGVDVLCISYTRLLWRTERSAGQWKINGLRGIYIRDTLQTAGPNQPLTLDEAQLATYRESYRYLSYVLQVNGRAVGNDLAGVDRPDLVDALRAAERQWLDQA